jgi:hypothetical protein
MKRRSSEIELNLAKKPKYEELETPLPKYVDKEMMMVAVSKNYKEFQYGTDELKRDPDVILSNPWTLVYYVDDPVLKNDPAMIHKAVCRSPRLFHASASPIRRKLLENRDLLLACIRDAHISLAYLPKEYHTKEVILATVKRDGFWLQMISDEFRNDWDVALAAVKQDIRTFQWVSPRLKRNRDFYVISHGMPNLYKKRTERFENCIIKFMNQ